MTHQPLLTAHNLHKRFSSVHAVRGILPRRGRGQNLQSAAPLTLPQVKEGTRDTTT